MGDTVDLATALAFAQSGLSTHSDAEMALMQEARDVISKAVADLRVARGVDVDPNAQLQTTPGEEPSNDVTQVQNTW